MLLLSFMQDSQQAKGHMCAQKQQGVLLMRMAWQDLLCLQVSTVVLRASTDNTLDDLERAVDDGVNAYKVCSRMLRHCPTKL